MVKSLTERIAARSIKIKPSQSAQNRAAFLALRLDIKQALNDGWPVKSIWETLHDEGKIDFSYQAFRGYANRLILSSPAKESPASLPVTSSTPAPEVSTPTKPATSQAVMKKRDKEPGFTFNSNPKKEDLL